MSDPDSLTVVYLDIICTQNLHPRRNSNLLVGGQSPSPPAPPSPLDLLLNLLQKNYMNTNSLDINIKNEDFLGAGLYLMDLNVFIVADPGFVKGGHRASVGIKRVW